MKKTTDLENLTERMSRQIAICIKRHTYKKAQLNTRTGEYEPYCTYHFFNESAPVACPYRSDQIKIKKKVGRFFNLVSYYRCER